MRLSFFKSSGPAGKFCRTAVHWKQSTGGQPQRSDPMAGKTALIL
ncbi:hypothetical protein [cyanobacterium endosymbiont of Epithemia turgida]|nr:hypothetical protein [cyanobacterium endosymbiont of Epithemia turgida]